MYLNVVDTLKQLFVSTASGYAQWAEWSTCSRTCRLRGVAGTRRRTRICEIPELGCDGPREQFEECNTNDCEGEQPRFQKHCLDSYFLIYLGQLLISLLHTK